ncbi:MAG: glutathione S-transferase [Gammaproteobacteria bacterium]|nr:glutathione S-transferase [Gammaproteobacteria bacterium]
MLKLYGFPVSNYFNMVKIALLEKGADFEYVHCMASQEDDYLSKSPMGKVPCIETDQGFLSETSVIFDYIEDTCDGPAFYPADPFKRAKVKELIKELELYVELPARTCYPEAFFGGEVSDEVKDKALTAIKKGLACIKRNGSFSPYIAGADITYADFFLMYSLNLVGAVGKRVFKTDLLEDFPEAKKLMSALGERESAKTVAQDQKSAA